MKYTIEGFNQREVIKLGNLDIVDLVILRWIVDFEPKMTKKEIDNEIYIFNKKKLINYSTTKKIIFDSDMLKYMDDLYSYFEKEKKIVIDSIKGSNYVLIRNEKDILCNISVTMSDTNDSLSKLNVDKNVSIDYLNNNLTEKGFYCVLE